VQTRDQEYASSAYVKVTKLKAEKKVKEQYAPYGAMAHRLPILIRTAGLVQALEFVGSRGKPVQQNLLTDLADTLGKSGSKALLEQARNAELSEYMRLTQQTLSALLWYKRFAQSVLDIDASEATENKENEGEQ